MDREAWRAAIHGVSKSRTRLSGWTDWLTAFWTRLLSRKAQFISITQSCLTFCEPHGIQHARFPCPLPTPEVYSNSCPLSQWCHLTISSTVAPLLLLPSLFPSIRIFSNKSALRIRWPEYWSFSFIINPSNEYSGLISFRMDWFDLAVQGTLKSFL